jgi:hypothetical protein
VCGAFEVLDKEAAFPENSDRESFNAESVYQATQMDSAHMGLFERVGLLSLVQHLSFWRMKQRACTFGQTGGHHLLSSLFQATVTKNVRFHLTGHSFGCIVVSAMLAGPNGNNELPRPVDSLALIQGALSHWAFCERIPFTKMLAGQFYSVIKDRKVSGPLLTTQSEFDRAVGNLYPLAAGVARQIAFAPGELPKYGAVGTFGIRGPGLEIVDIEMLDCHDEYSFDRGKIYNIESSQFIRNGGGVSGAHSDIANPEVAHAIWQAAMI